MNELIFPKNFKWGAATASYQIEGAYAEDGKGESIWDNFSHKRGNILNGDTGKIACDHYHRFTEDIELIDKIGLDTYRFSISWPRILPRGKGQVNQKGIDFYKRLCNSLLEKGIEPAVTLYHWDLPQALQEKGGWANRDTAKYFNEYAEIVFSELGDLVKTWITHNEPWVVAFVGNIYGEHAPGNKDYKKGIQVLHNLLLSHGMAVRTFQDMNLAGEIGITLNLGDIQPATEKPTDKEAASLQDQLLNRITLEPLFKGNYPEQLFEIYTSEFGPIDIESGDLELINNPIDFLGINYYTRNIIKNDPQANGLGISEVKPADKEYTEMNWEVYPEGLYNVLKRVNADYTDLPLYVTENGAAFNDEISNDGKVHDERRISYLQGHFQAAHQAIEAGIPLQRYYVWSLMDNFEWSYGYTKRFGLIFIDYQNKQERILKDSAYWYQSVIERNGLVLDN